MKFFHRLIVVLAAVQLLLAGIGLLGGLFADGGLWERIPIVVVHPIAAVALLVVAVKSKPVSKRLKDLAATLLLVNIAVDIALAVLIGAGVARGDWWLPLIFSAIPAVGVLYVWMLRTKK